MTENTKNSLAGLTIYQINRRIKLLRNKVQGWLKEQRRLSESEHEEWYEMRAEIKALKKERDARANS